MRDCSTPRSPRCRTSSSRPATDCGASAANFWLRRESTSCAGPCNPDKRVNLIAHPPEDISRASGSGPTSGGGGG